MEVFGQRPYDEVRIDEIAERAGVSRALMYHYFPDKRAFFVEVIRVEADQLFEATNTLADTGRSLFDRLRAGVMAYLDYHQRHPHGSWAAHVGLGRTDPALVGVDDERQMRRIMDAMGGVAAGIDAAVERDLEVVVYAWLAFTLEMCRRRLIDPSLDAGRLADACAHALLDTVTRVPGIPAALAAAVAPDAR